MSDEHESHTLRDLTDRQRIAIEALPSGATDREAADAAEVARETVNRWANHHPEFQAELNRRRRLLQSQHVDRIRQMDGLMLDHIHQRMMDGDSEAFTLWMKGRNLNRIETSVTGPDDCEDIITARVDRRLWLLEQDNVVSERQETHRMNFRVDCTIPDRIRVQELVERELRAENDCDPVPGDEEPDWDIGVVYPEPDEASSGLSDPPAA
jgi:hypothetical protein